MLSFQDFCGLVYNNSGDVPYLLFSLIYGQTFLWNTVSYLQRFISIFTVTTFKLDE